MFEVEGKENSWFSRRQVIKCFVIPLSSKRQKHDPKEIVCFTPAGSQIGSGFKEHDLITCESKVQVVVSQGVTEFCSPQGVSDF